MSLHESKVEDIRIRDDIAFFQAVRSALVKPSSERKTQEDLDQAIRQLDSKAVSAEDEFIDAFTAEAIRVQPARLTSRGGAEHQRAGHPRGGRKCRDHRKLSAGQVFAERIVAGHEARWASVAFSSFACELVYAIYCLTPEEIKLVEEGTRK